MLEETSILDCVKAAHAGTCLGSTALLAGELLPLISQHCTEEDGSTVQTYVSTNEILVSLIIPSTKDYRL